MHCKKSTVSLLCRFTFFFFVGIALCSCSSKPESKEGVLLEQAYNALKENNWAQFESVYLNRYKVVSRTTSKNIFAEQQSYSGSIMAPEEKRKVQQRFGSAAAGESPNINFKKETFKDVVLLENTVDEIISEFGKPNYPVQIYAIKTKESPDAAAPRYPYFVVSTVVIPKVIDIILSEEEEEEEELLSSE